MSGRRVGQLGSGAGPEPVPRTGTHPGDDTEVIAVCVPIEFDGVTRLGDDRHALVERSPDAELGGAGPSGPRAQPIHGRSGASSTSASGGSEIETDAARPWAGVDAAVTPPRLPTPLPPYASASPFTSSVQRPAIGTP